MVITRKQSEIIDVIQDSKVKSVFETCAKLEDISDNVEWHVKIIHADSFSKEDPCALEDYTKEEYMFDNERLVEFLNRCYGINRKVSFQISPDRERIYLNNKEVTVVGTPNTAGVLIVSKHVDTFDVNIDTKSGKDIDLYRQLMDRLPGRNWSISNSEGLIVDESGDFDELDSKIVPFFDEGEVELREMVKLNHTLDCKWLIIIEHALDPCFECRKCCEEACCD